MNTQPLVPLWSPTASGINKTHMKKFMDFCGRADDNYQQFWQWSVENIEEFWDRFWDYSDIIGAKGSVVLDQPDKMLGGQFFTAGSVNYAENLLRHRNDRVAIIFRDEKGQERTLSFNQLYDQVSLWAQAFKAQGVQKGDRVAAYMPNMPETIIACLAAASLGVVFSSASPDFGVQGIIDRFGQIEPKILITADGYYYGGKTLNCLDKVKEAQGQIKGLEKTIVVPFVGEEQDLSDMSDTILIDEALDGYSPQEIDFATLNFNHPLFIMFSSGTTGVPKCIVHGHGGTLIQHMKEHQLHCDMQEGDPMFYFTTCGWMMWNWLITGLASGAPLLLYDGNPMYPDENALWEFTSKHKAKMFGTSAKYIDALKKAEVAPKENFDLGHLKILTSTGSPLVHESFDYIYDAIKPDVHLASIYGGTDIISASFGIGNPVSPVWRGEIQGPALATAVDIFDSSGASVDHNGGAGELVCTKPIPSMPIGFWNDPDAKRYHQAYFARYDNVWHHGDWVEKTAHGGLIVHGRSDATLNPGGVRIGTSEIYRQVEKIPDVMESIAVGQDWDGDVRVILFVKLQEREMLSESLIHDIKSRIRDGASPRHVPTHVIQVTDIPRTKSGKITELAVRDVIHGREVKNKEALANPEALDLYKDLAILQQTKNNAVAGMKKPHNGALKITR